MKQIFTLFFFILLGLALNAQQVLIKDSVVESENGGPFTLRGVTHNFYNNSCKLASYLYNGSNNKELITYYSNGNVSQEIVQTYDSTSNSYENVYRDTFVYNNAGKVISDLYGAWDNTNKKFIIESEDTSIYDQNNNLIEESLYQTDSSGNLYLFRKSNYYDYDNGNYDSSVIEGYNDTSLATIQHYKYYYTYYDPTKRNFQELIYYYDSANTFYKTDRLINFHDSANYISNDSLVDETKSISDTSFQLFYINVFTNIYNTDGLKIEYDNGFYFYSIYDLDKTYYTYGLCSSALAVSLLKFYATQQYTDVNLLWQTASEVNTLYFNIQRSSDGIHFNAISKVKAASNSASTKNYSYTDVNIAALHADRLYYRLQEVDKDGKSSYSNIQVVDLKNNILFTISPNPAKDYINIVASGNVTNAQVSVTDMNGRTLYTGKQNFTTNQQIKIPASQFGKQVLIVIINANNGKQEFKVVKE